MGERKAGQVAGRKRNLTPKQERFALEYFKTGNASKAYRIAYDCQNMAPETINRKALEVLENGMIAARIERLRAKAEAKGMRSKEEALEMLWNWANKSERDRAQVMKLIGKFMGWEAPTRQQIEHALASPFEKFMDTTESEPDTEPETNGD